MPLVSHGGERTRRPHGLLTRLLHWAADHEVEVLLPTIRVIDHAMVDPKGDFPSRGMRSEELRTGEKVEEDAPARELGVVIASGMVLPAMQVSLLQQPRPTHRPSQDVRSMHV